MKAIVANVLFGGIFGCLNYANSAQANPVSPEFSATRSIVSTNFSTQPPVSSILEEFNLIGKIFATNSLYGHSPHLSLGYDLRLQRSLLTDFESTPASYLAPQLLLESDCTLGFCTDEFGDRSTGEGDRLLSSQKQYIHQSPAASVVVGFQNTFWPSTKQGKYWGITTVAHWGNSASKQLNQPQSNYISSPPILAAGSAALTFSGGGNHNLANKTPLDRNVNSDREFEDFRGGITYHQGLAKQLTMGIGFVYEDVFAGFTQLTYKSSILPITTTVSLIAKDTSADFHSHIRFQPSNNFMVNYHYDGSSQKFDANLGIYPGLTFIASGDSEQENYSTGIKVAVQNNYFSLTATAAMDRERNLQWNLNSQIGRFKLVHSSNKNKTSSELSSQLVGSTGIGLQCSAFIKYQTRQVKQRQQEFTVWGGRLNSQNKVGQNHHQWSLDLGYGTSPHGRGLIASGSVALKPDLFVKLNYQEISAVSDETKIKLELGSR